MTDGERGSLLLDDDPVGAMRLATTVAFGRRVAALSGVATAGHRAEGRLFGAAGSFGWPWPDHISCSSLTVRTDGPTNPA
jgi:hypothetical protein